MPRATRSWALFLLALILVAAGCRRKTDPADMPLPPPAEALAPLPPDLAQLRYPTAQDKITDPNAVGVFQHTGSGNEQSGRFGSVRTGANGLARFHEGIDIATLQRDGRGRPLDTVHAAAPGTVALVSRVAGNSDYGKHVVLLHDDPIGRVYTLYAHMAETAAGLTEGQQVVAGQLLGMVGNTALEPIPMARAHLHFEIGLLSNPQFLTWPARKQKNTPGGLFNGQNLLGLDPVEVFRQRFAQGEAFTLLDHVRPHPVAFSLLVRARRPLAFFDAHPALWVGEPYRGEAMVLSVAESGLPLRGRNATAEELAGLGKQIHKVLQVDPLVLGRNGRRHIVNSGGRWNLGQNGGPWLDLLTHPGGLRKP